PREHRHASALGGPAPRREPLHVPPRPGRFQAEAPGRSTARDRLHLFRLRATQAEVLTMGGLSRSIALALLPFIFGSPPLARSLQENPAPRPGALVPAYFYPAGKGLKAWQQLAADARSTTIEAILNPASGPGTKRDPTYVTVVGDFRKAGGKVLGYISTSYA